MKPADFRNENYHQIRARISGQRQAVLDAWLIHGPGTTKDVAARAGISILTFRPRTTELVELGFVRLCDAQSRHGEGMYRAATADESLSFFQTKQAELRTQQSELAL